MTDSSPDKAVILVVDDSKVIRRAASKMLGDDYEVIEAADGLEGWEHISTNDAISVVFTDMQMPQMNGLQLLAKVRESDDDRIAALPVIMVTGAEDNEDSKKRVFDAGATDFVSKPFGSIDLISRAKSHAVLNRRVAELEKQSAHDKLTGLFNASSLDEQGSKAFSFVQRHHVDMTVVLLEIENFQQIYLAHGKAVAQQIIVEVSKRLSESMRTEDIAARTGVARFALLMSLTSVSDARVVVSRINTTIGKLVFATGKDKLRVNLAAGISAFEQESQKSFSELLKKAESALHKATQGETEEEPAEAVAEKAEAVVAPEVTDADIQAALNHVLQGNFIKIPPAHLQAVVERLAPFMQYANKEHSNQRAAKGGSAE